MRIPTGQLATLMVASIFAARAVLRLSQAEFNILRFAVLGWPPWAVWLISAAELAGALLLLSRVTFGAGAALLAVVAGAFIWRYASLGVAEAAYGDAGLLIALAGAAVLRRNYLRATTGSLRSKF